MAAEWEESNKSLPLVTSIRMLVLLHLIAHFAVSRMIILPICVL